MKLRKKDRPRFFAVTLDIEVSPGRAHEIIKTARDKAETDGAGRGIIKDVGDALQYLLDPAGDHPDGFEILNSSVEETTSAADFFCG
jgi:hypothetical protein